MDLIHPSKNTVARQIKKQNSTIYDYCKKPTFKNKNTNGLKEWENVYCINGCLILLAA